jgi:RHS repeat-associated protein
VHAYDALGRRVRTTTEAYVGGQWTAFSSTERDFIGRLPLGIETTFADGSSKSWRFLRGPDVSGTLEGAGGARGVLAILKDASSWKAVAADTLGNVLALAGTGGDFTRRTFDPWGNPLVRDASGSLRASTLTERRADYDALPLACASQEYDPDTGLTHYHFREYSPSLGGWLTTDPIGLAGGYLNLRSYLGNRPMDALDKDGRWLWIAAWAGVGAIVGGVTGYMEKGTLEGALKGAGKGVLVFGVAALTMGAGAVVLGAEAASVTGAALIGGTGGAAAQVTDNLLEGAPFSKGVAQSTVMGAIAGGMFQSAGNAVARAYNPYGPLPKMVPPSRATPQQAAENVASKQSRLSAEGAQADAP